MNKLAYLVGICLRGILLGTLLFLAIIAMIIIKSNARIFLYQGF